MNIPPSEGAMIAADVASKAADVKIGFVDRFISPAHSGMTAALKTR